MAAKKIKNEKVSVVEEVKLDSMMVDEPKKSQKKPNLYPRDEDESDESTWDMPSKKDIADFEDDDLELDEKEESFSDIEEDEIFFREK